MTTSQIHSKELMEGLTISWLAREANAKIPGRAASLLLKGPKDRRNAARA
jgi:hypothetical protein